MRILHVITRSEWGGAQKVVYLLARKQQGNGHQVTVLCGEKGRLVDELENAGIRVKLNPYFIRKLSWRDFPALLLLWKEARRGYDVIHAHSSKAGVLARLVGKFNRTSICFTVHGFGISSSHSRMEQVLYHWIEGFWARFTDALVFVSPGNRQVAKDKGWLKHCRNFCVIRNGIELPPVQNVEKHKKSEIRQQLGIPVDAFVIGNLARVAWIKNPDFWVKVAKEFTENFPDSYFIWFGGGDEIKSYRSEQRIVFAGEITDIDSALLSFDVLLLTSHSEGMPLAVLEGMARGVPILAPDLPGLKDCIVKGGKVFSQSNLEQVLENLSELRDPQIRKVLGEQGIKECRERFSVDRMAAEYEMVYQKLIRK